MKKYFIIILSQFFFVGYMFAVTIDISNESGKNIEYTINKGEFKGWKKLINKEKSLSDIKGNKKIIIKWRDKEDIFVSQELNRPVNFTFMVGGRYKIVEKNWLGKKSKPKTGIFLYHYKRLPEYLLAEKRSKFLLPLAKLKEGIEKVREIIKYYKSKINQSRELAKQYGKMLKSVKNKSEKKGLISEKDLAEKRVKDYLKQKDDSEKLEQELLIREIIEKYREKIKDLKARGRDAKIHEDSMRKHKDMFKKLTGESYPF